MDEDKLNDALKNLGLSGSDNNLRVDPETGKVQEEHWWGWEDTGTRIDPQSGNVQEEHWHGWEDTGTRVDPERGAVQEEHWYGWEDSGARVDPKSGKIQDGHWYGWEDSGMRVDPASGRLQEEHWYGWQPVTGKNVTPRASRISASALSAGRTASGSSSTAPKKGGLLFWVIAAALSLAAYFYVKDSTSLRVSTGSGAVPVALAPKVVPNAGPVPFHDDAPRVPELLRARNLALQAVLHRRTAELLTVVDPQIKIGFGGDYGHAAFVEWLDQPNAHAWDGLELALQHGGKFERNDFIAPYMWTSAQIGGGPSGRDLVVAYKDRTPVRAAPNTEAEEIANLTHEAVYLLDYRFPDTKNLLKEPWYQIRSIDGTEGWVPKTLLYTGYDFRLMFTLRAGSWLLTGVFAGD